jgi:hypothetical protein
MDKVCGWEAAGWRVLRITFAGSAVLLRTPVSRQAVGEGKLPINAPIRCGACECHAQHVRLGASRLSPARTPYPFRKSMGNLPENGLLLRDRLCVLDPMTLRCSVPYNERRLPLFRFPKTPEGRI